MTEAGRGARLSTERKVRAAFAFALGCLGAIGALAWLSPAIAKPAIMAASGLAFAFVAAARWSIGRDFAGSRRAEAALREARDHLEERVRERTAELAQLDECAAYLASFPEKNPIPIVEIDAAGEGVHYINPAAARLFPTLKKTGVRHPLLAGVQAAAQPLLTGRAGPLQHEVGVDGRTYLLTVNFFPETKRLRIYGNDITERKRADAALQESGERLRLALAATSQGMYDLNVQTGACVVSPEYARMLGYDPGDFIETNAAWNARLHPEDREETRRIFDEYLAGRIAEYRVEFRQRTKAGGWLWLLSLGKVIEHTSDGKPLRMLGTHTDITRRREAEEVVRQERDFSEAVLNSLPGVLYLYDETGKFLRWNKNFERVTGYTGEEIARMHPLDFFAGAEKELLAARIGEVFAKGESNVEAGFVSKDGRVTPYYFTGVTTVLDGKTCLVGVGIDIAERTLAEEKVNQLNAELEGRVAERTAQLEAANQELEAFSYSVSHDLRAPLRTVDGFSQAVLEDYGAQIPADGRRYLETIRQGAQRMGNLIDDLLAFARLGRVPLSRQPVDAARLVREIWEDLAPQREGRRVEFRAGDLPACSGDLALLRQVWINLLSNAVKYSRQRDPAVIETGSVVEAGETVWFVRDNGTGFDMRYAHKLFGVFQRLHRAEEYEGTGVGLAIVQRVIQRHGGRVWAEAEVDRGAAFFFTLPEPN